MDFIKIAIVSLFLILFHMKVAKYGIWPVKNKLVI